MTDFLEIMNNLRIFFPRNFTTFESILESFLRMNGSKTMLNISRWVDGKICYKTIERFYDRKIKWLEMNLFLITQFIPFSGEVLLASDETVQGKSGKKTSGLDMFFSSILQKPIKSVCFSGLSLIVPEHNKSFPLLMNQLIYTDADKAKKLLAKKLKKAKNKVKGKVGRPKGSKSDKTKVKDLAPTFRLLEEQLIQLKEVLMFKVKHFLGDGKYGNNTVVNLCKKYHFYVISKLQNNSALFFEYTGEQSGRGKPKQYGDKLDYNNIPSKYLISEELKDKTITRTYQMNVLSRSFDDKINIVIIHKTIDDKVAHSIFFSNDLTLKSKKIVDNYSLRFQIEFNFRDSKEFWGLSDFMNVKKERIHNASNLAIFMCNLSYILLHKFRIKNQNSDIGIRDLISNLKADYYYNKIIKLLCNFNPNLIIPKDITNITSIGAIHT